jgi:hypothetical protein
VETTGFCGPKADYWLKNGCGQKFLVFPKLPAAITIEFTKGRSAHNNRVIQHREDTNKRKVVRRFAIDDWRLAIATSNCKSKIRNRKSCYSPCVRRVGFLICPPCFLAKTRRGDVDYSRAMFLRNHLAALRY